MKLLLLILFFVTSTGRASALLPTDVISSVITHFPSITAAVEEKKLNEAEVTTAEGAFDLRLRNRLSAGVTGYYQNQKIDSVLEKPTPYWGSNLYVGYRMGRGEFPIYDEKQKTMPSGEVRAGIDIPIWRDGPTDRRRTNIAKSELSVENSRWTIEQQKIDSVRTALTRYWAWVANGKKVGIVRELVKTAETRDVGLAERVKHGDVAKIERSDNKRSLFQRTAQLIAAERAFQQSAIELSLFVRNSDGAPLIPDVSRLPQTLPEPADEDEHADLGKLVALAWETRPELRRLTLSIEQNELEASWAKNQLVPRVDLNLQASQDLGTSDPTRSPGEIEAGLVLEIPLERRVASGRVAAAVASENRLNAQLRLAKDRIAADVQDALSAIRASIQRLKEIRQELDYAIEVEKGERIRFKNGESNILFVNLREQTTADTALREVDALFDYHIAKALLQASLGQYQPAK